MRDDRDQNDRSEYTNTGFRDPDGREGFGDDKGTRVGRPDGAESAQRAPLDAQGGGSQSAPGQPGTNTASVADGIEGSIQDDESTEGPQQSRVRAASEGVDVDAEREEGDERPTYNL